MHFFTAFRAKGMYEREYQIRANSSPMPEMIANVAFF